MRGTILSKAVVGAVVISWLAGCATDRLDAAPPSGVNLTGEWVLNLNLSDDPDKMGPDPDTSTPMKAPGSHRGHGGGRGGPGGGGGMGMPPIGTTPDDPTASTGIGNNPGVSADTGSRNGNSFGAGTGTSAYEQAGYGFVPVGLQDSPPAGGPSGAPPGPPPGKPSRGASINHLLRAPLAMSITQDKGSLTIRSNMPDGTQTADTYTAGTKSTIPFGKDDSAERTAGWRGPVFVVTTSAKKFGRREDEFAIDSDDGRLIMTTLTKGGKLGKVEITRVYDRVKAH